jgi:hypothetical protein
LLILPPTMSCVLAALRTRPFPVAKRAKASARVYIIRWDFDEVRGQKVALLVLS